MYQESLRQLVECFGRVRKNLPDAEVKIFLDGVDRPEVLKLASTFGFTAEPVTHCGCNDRWFLWWLRMLGFFQSTKADYCFKIDPDTMVDRPPVIVHADYFGTINHLNGYNYIQGGVTGLSQRAVGLLKPVLESGHFKSVSDCVAGSIAEWVFADDHAIAHALQQVDIFPTKWDECFSVWRTSVPNADLQFAIVHPRYYAS